MFTKNLHLELHTKFQLHICYWYILKDETDFVII
jgi:hypothetical protein